MNQTWSRFQRLWLPLVAISFGIQTFVFYWYGSDAFVLAQALTLAFLAGGSSLTTVYAAFSEQRNHVGVALVVLGFACFVFILAFAEIYVRTGLAEGDRIVTDRATAEYFSVITWTALGYGDVRPVGSSRFVSGIEAVFGYVYLGLFVTILVRALKDAARPFLENENATLISSINSSKGAKRK